MSVPPDLKIYLTDHLNSQVVCKAVALGSGGQIVPATKLLDGPACAYGILRGCDAILKEAWWVGRDTFHIDHGYFRRGNGDFRGHYRITRNALQVYPDTFEGFTDVPHGRWESLGLRPKPWRKSGDSVVVAPLSKALGNFLGIDPHQWLQAVINEIRQHTDRNIEIKAKDSDAPLSESLRNAWCLVSHSSNSAIDALLDGIPVFVTSDCASTYLASGSLLNIERPRYPEREAWFRILAYSQWTLAEIQRGECWDWL